MPYPNEHALRLKDPSKIDKIRVRRTKGSGDGLVNGVKIPNSISVIWYIISREGKEVPIPQALRFPTSTWTAEKVQSFIKSHELGGTFEAASKEDAGCTITVIHADRVSKTIGGVKRTDEGYLTGTAPVAKVGILSYLLNDGSIRRELVSEETLFNHDSMNSLKMKPVTDSHPVERSVNVKNAGKRKVGFTGETVRKDGDFLTTSLTVTDESAIDNIDKGKQELSPGYQCELLLQSGTFNGQNYDAIQTKRTYNHLALCDTARGGPDIRLHLDSDSADDIDGFEIDGIYTDEEDIHNRNNDDNFSHSTRSRFMSILKLDGIDYNADQQVINAFDKATAKCDSLQAEKDQIQAKLDSAEDKIKTLESRNIDAEVSAGVKNRVALHSQASKYLDKEVVDKIDTLTDADVRKAIITKAFPNADLTEKSDEYIKARYDSALELLDENEKKNGKREDADKIANQRKAAKTDGTDDGGEDAEPDQEKSRNDMIDRLKNPDKDKNKK